VEILAKLRLVGGEIYLKRAAKISRALGGPFFGFLHSLLGLAALISWHATASSSYLGVSESDDGTDALYGLGAYLTNGQLSGRLEATSAEINGTRVYRVTLGAYWSFR
jgi:hypothetical protein